MSSARHGSFAGRALDGLLAQLRDSVAFVDRDGRILLTNRAEELPPERPSTRIQDLGDLFQIFHPDGRPYEAREWPVLRSARTGELIVEEEFFRMGADGNRRSFSCDCAPFRDDQRRIAGAVLVTREITERKRSRDQLAYLLPLLDHTEDAIIAFDPDWRVTAWNKGAERMYRFSAREALGRELRNVMRVEMSEEQHAEARREVAERGRWRGEVAVRRRNGPVISVESIDVTIRDEHGQITGYLAIHRDVTERRQAENQLRDAKRRTEAILESITESFSALDPEWRYTYLNHRALERIQQVEGKAIKLDDLIGKNVWEAFPHLVGTSSEHELHRAVREQQQVIFETHSPCTGEWLEVHAYPAKEGGLSIYGRDITERKRTEEQLRYHASLFDNTNDAVLATDADFVLTAWNRGAERMFGWTAEEAMGRRVYELIPTSFSDEEMAAALSDLPKTGRWRGQATWYDKHGKPVVAEGHTVAQRSDQGQISGYVCIMRDFSELRRATSRLETAAHEQALLADLSLRALSSNHLEALLDDAVAVVGDVLDVPLGSIGELEPGAEQLSWRAAFGWRNQAIANASPSPAGIGSFVGYTLMAGEPVISEDVRADERFRVSALFGEQVAVSAAAVVIPGPQHPFGVLTVAARERRAFESTEVKFMQAVANTVGIAVERANLDKGLVAAREAERTRIARDLHDEGLRELTDALGIAMLARSEASGPREEQRWTTLAASLQRLGQQLRSAIYDLRLGSDEDRGFAGLLEDLVKVQSGLAVDCRVQLHGRERLPFRSLGHRGAEVRQIVREAITNARRHSSATTILVDAGASTEDFLRVAVSDDGDWPDREGEISRRQGTGILSMVERANGLRATLRIEERQDGGTTVSLEVPFSGGNGGNGDTPL